MTDCDGRGDLLLLIAALRLALAVVSVELENSAFTGIQFVANGRGRTKRTESTTRVMRRGGIPFRGDGFGSGKSRPSFALAREFV